MPEQEEPEIEVTATKPLTSSITIPDVGSVPIPPHAPEPYRQDEMEPTPASGWNSPRKQGFLVRLPSGNVCRVKRLMDFGDLVRDGKLPNPLGAVVLKQLQAGNPLMDLKEMDPASQLQAVAFIDEQVCRMMIEPKCFIPPETDEMGNPVAAEFWEPPLPGAISILDLTQEDRIFLFNVAQGGATDLDRFREVQSGLTALVENRPRVPRQTKRTGGTERGKRRSAGKR